MTNLMRLIWLRRLFKGGGGSVIKTISGVAPLVFTALSGALHSLTQYGLCVQDGTPTPSAPVDIVCNNGAIKYWSGNKWTEEGMLVGYIIQVSTQEIVANSNYRVSAVILLRAGDYAVRYTADATGARPFIVWATTQNGDLLPNASVWSLTRPEVGVNTGTFTLAEDTYVRISWRNSFTNITVQPVTPSIYVDGTPEVISVGGMNLFDKDSEQSGNYYVNSNGNIATANTNASIYFRCQPNTTYYFMHTAVTGGARAFTVSADEWTIGTPANEMVGTTTSTAGTVRSITTEADAKWIFFLYGRSSGTAATFEEQAADFIVSTYPLTSSTQYEPYKGAPQTASAENLYAVGDIADEQDIISGAVTRKVGVKVLDGTESWNYGGNSSGEGFYLSVPEAKLGEKPISTHFQQGATYGYGIADMSISRFSATSQSIVVRYDDCLSGASVTPFKAFLAAQYAAGTPVIVIYPLAEEVTETVTPQPLTTAAGTNSVDATAEVSPITLEIEYKGAAA